MILRLIAAAAIAAIMGGCSLNRTAARVTAGLVNDGLDTVFSQSDLEYARAALPSNLQLMEILIANDPGNKTLLTDAAMGFCGYSLMFIEDENKERASAFYKKGQSMPKRLSEEKSFPN